MKDKKIPDSIKIVIILAAIVFAAGLIYMFVDQVLNGSVLDWLMYNYTETLYYESSDGVGSWIPVPNWRKIRQAVGVVGVTAFIVISFAVVLIPYLYAKYKKQQAVDEICKMIGKYMNRESEAGEVFSSEYASVAAQLVQIKSDIRYRQQLMKEENEKKNDLITYLAHDLKTPLTSVIGYLSLLDEVRDMPQPQREKYVHIAAGKAERLEKLINEFFDITRYNLTHIILEKETIDLYYMLTQMVDEFYPILKTHGNTVKLSADENLLIYADPEKLARVFNNILKNAVAYSYKGTEICISAKEEDERLEICFTNHGRTVPEHKLVSIFEKFYRLDDARMTNSGGAGLGLAIAREIVRLHGGFITAQSQNEETSFKILLPSRTKALEREKEADL